MIRIGSIEAPGEPASSIATVEKREESTPRVGVPRPRRHADAWT